MGLRDKMRKRLKTTINKLSGEHLEMASGDLTPYERPGTPDEDVQILRPRKTRPPGAKRDGEK